MENTTINQTELLAYAERILKQYKNNYFLSGIEIKPALSETGTIKNIEKFIEIKENTRPAASCDTPLEKISSLSPQAVAAILKGIHTMDTSQAEKQVLFDIYIERTKDAEAVSDELLDKAYLAFAKAYDDKALERPIRRS